MAGEDGSGGLLGEEVAAASTAAAAVGPGGGGEEDEEDEEGELEGDMARDEGSEGSCGGVTGETSTLDTAAARAAADSPDSQAPGDSMRIPEDEPLPLRDRAMCSDSCVALECDDMLPANTRSASDAWGEA